MAALYPPIVASSMPAFDVNIANSDGVKIYFTLPVYMEPRWMDSVHVVIRRQSSNVNVTNNDRGFLVKAPELEKETGRYFITLNGKEDIRKSLKESTGTIDSKLNYNTGFQAGIIYKIQLRTSSVGNKHEDPYGNGQYVDDTEYRTTTADYFSRNGNTYSQWSTVSLIKAIHAPNFYINGFSQSENNYFSYSLPDFMGIYEKVYINENDNEITSTQYLKYWRMRLLNNNYSTSQKTKISDYTLVDSGWNMVSANNYITEDNDNSLSLDCSLPYQLKDDETYKILFEIRTNNNYVAEKLYTFTYEPANVGELDGDLITYVNEEEGYIKVVFTPQNNNITYTNICLRRSDSKTNFLKWEDLKNETITELTTTKSWVYYDFTPQSGRAYKYLIQKRDTRGRRGKPIYDKISGGKEGKDNPGKNLAEWQHAFLLESNTDGQISLTKQLKLKYDFQISSWKTNISESKTDTIGSKYPYIRRNGNMYYRSFPISGTITAYMDNADLLTSKKELYDDYTNYNQTEDKNYHTVYESFQKKQGYYTRQYDYTYERQFREKVEQFLYNSKPKLYKSMQEGNVLIKLMEVSLTPKNELGRLIYTFSATAYEIDQATIQNYNKYNFIQIGTFKHQITSSKDHIGQVPIPQNGFNADQDILGTGSSPAANSIASQEKYNESINNTKVTGISLKWLRLTVESDPYLIYKDTEDNIIIDEAEIQNKLDQVSNDDISRLYKIGILVSQNGVIYLGTLIYINNKPIIIPVGNNVYQIKDNELQINSIIPAKDGLKAYIDYVANITIDNDASDEPIDIKMQPIFGQETGTYQQSDNIINKIKKDNAYNFINDEGEHINQYISGIKTILIDTEPGTEIEVRTSSMSKNDKSILKIDETGELYLDPCNSIVTIDRLIIKGIPEDSNYLPVDALIFYTANLRRDVLP